jgi:hypothetical protein
MVGGVFAISFGADYHQAVAFAVGGVIKNDYNDSWCRDAAQNRG